MGDKQEHDAANEADRSPPLFAVLETVARTEMQRIIENQPRRLEANAMLYPIGAVLVFIPFKLRREAAKLYIHYCTYNSCLNQLHAKN